MLDRCDFLGEDEPGIWHQLRDPGHRRLLLLFARHSFREEDLGGSGRLGAGAELHGYDWDARLFLDRRGLLLFRRHLAWIGGEPGWHGSPDVRRVAGSFGTLHCRGCMLLAKHRELFLLQA